jgi:hypothetical protein
VRAGLLSIDLASRVVTLKDKHIQLTRKEYALLHGLATHVGLVVTHQQLIRDIWGHMPATFSTCAQVAAKGRSRSYAAAGAVTGSSKASPELRTGRATYRQIRTAPCAT